MKKHKLSIVFFTFFVLPFLAYSLFYLYGWLFFGINADEDRIVVSGLTLIFTVLLNAFIYDMIED